MEKVCIVCPRGCHLEYRYEGDKTIVKNNACARGPEYLEQELKAPKRMLTTTIRVKNGVIPVVPVHAGEYVDKEDVSNIISYLKEIEVEAPIKCNTEVTGMINGKEIHIYTSKDVDQV